MPLGKIPQIIGKKLADSVMFHGLNERKCTEFTDIAGRWRAKSKADNINESS